jgi:hypothetical protein
MTSTAAKTHQPRTELRDGMRIVGWAKRSVPTAELRVGTPLRGFAHPTSER